MHQALQLKPIIRGRVFTRDQQFHALPQELQDEVGRLILHIETIQNEVFGHHRTLQFKMVRGVRYKKLRRIIDMWLQPSGITQAAIAPVARTGSNVTDSKALSEASPASDQSSDGSGTQSEEEAIVDETPTTGHAQELILALVLKGFITPHKEDKVLISLSTEELEFKEMDMLVPLAPTITGLTIPTTTVWDVANGAIFASLLKRKAGFLAPLTHGKDVYVVVNAPERSITLFASDVAREPLFIFEATATHVTFDKAQFENGLKLWSGTDVEVLAATSLIERDAFLAALEAIGVKYLEQFPIIRRHRAGSANFTTSHTFTVEEVTRRASDAVPLDDSTETVQLPWRGSLKSPSPTKHTRKMIPPSLGIGESQRSLSPQSNGSESNETENQQRSPTETMSPMSDEILASKPVASHDKVVRLEKPTSKSESKETHEWKLANTKTEEPIKAP